MLEVTVYDEDRDRSADFLGKVAIPLLNVSQRHIFISLSLSLPPSPCVFVPFPFPMGIIVLKEHTGTGIMKTCGGRYKKQGLFL